MVTRENSKLLWRCRRGARELDSILVPYGSAQIHSMTSAEKSNLDNLLKQQDPDLLDWFLGKTTPEDASIADAVRDVLAFSTEGERAK